jgi:polysaccharide export outer membrane protein
MFDMRLGGMPAEYAQEFALQFTVGQDGSVNIPLIGEIKAAGLTGSQLERTIQNRLMAEKIFTRPTVIISIAQVARFVSVSGGVRAPQRLQWNPDLSLSSAIGNSGGLSDFGSPKGIRIVREGKVVGVFNLKDIQGDPAKDVKLLPGDQVLVRE